MLDPNSIQRIELAGVLMDIAAPLGKAQALELVFPTIAQVISPIYLPYISPRSPLDLP